MSEWIRVGDKFPEYDERVLVTDGESVWVTEHLLSSPYLSITHWMPIPKLPKALPNRVFSFSADRDGVTIRKNDRREIFGLPPISLSLAEELTRWLDRLWADK